MRIQSETLALSPLDKALIKLKDDASVSLKAQMWTNSSSPPSVTAVSYLSLTMACCVCMCVCISCTCEQAKYKSKAKDLLKSGCNELLRPDILTALYTSIMGSKVNRHTLVTQCTSDPCPQTCSLRSAVSGHGLIISHAHPVDTPLRSTHYKKGFHPPHIICSVPPLIPPSTFDFHPFSC